MIQRRGIVIVLKNSFTKVKCTSGFDSIEFFNSGPTNNFKTLIKYFVKYFLQKNKLNKPKK